ncbi:MAG: hypothetical protein AB7V08_02825 [Elusimicrobiales bacterium]
MEKNLSFLLAAALTALLFLNSPAPAAEAPANALLVVPSETAFDRKFQDYLEKKGAKLLESHPPSVFVGHIPQDLDRELEEKYGARVYRQKVDDWASFARYGENAVFAVNAWNKRFVEDPPVAPLVVSSRVQKAGRRALRLTWNNVMKAASYRLQISGRQDFSELNLETLLSRNQYTLYPFFLEDGVYYWRVAPLVRLNTGEVSERGFSAVYTFAVSNTAAPAKLKNQAPSIAGRLGVSNGVLAWPNPSDLKYYRLQLSDRESFEAPLADVFTDTCSYRMSGLPLESGRLYYMRVMGSDGKSPGVWSAPAQVPNESGPADAKRRSRRR